jgi:hypothetical protein
MQLFTDETEKELKLAIKHSHVMISRMYNHEDTSAKLEEIHILCEIILWIV